LVSRGKGLIGVGFALIVFSMIYLFILFSGKPLSIFQTELFSPYRFSLNKVIPSLGHLLMLGILAASFFNPSFPSLSGKGEKGKQGYC